METVNRILQEKITARIAPNKAVLIFGARRVGKTVMMRKIVDNYSEMCIRDRHREFYFWRTYDKQEIDLIEESADSLTALEFKWGNKMPVSYTHLASWWQTYAGWCDRRTA